MTENAVGSRALIVAGGDEVTPGSPEWVAQDERRRIVQLWILISVVFLWACAGDVTNLIVGGRLPASLTSTGRVAETAIGATVGSAAELLGYAGVAAILFYNVIRRRGSFVLTWPLGLIIAFFVSITLANFVASGSVDARFGSRIAIAIAIAVWSIQPQLRDLRVIGAFSFGIAASSFALIPFEKAWMLRADFALLEKALIGDDLLAGPFPQSNILGLVLAVGIGFIFLMKHLTWRVIALVTVAIALVLSGSRTSIIAVGAALVIALIAAPIRSKTASSCVYAIGALAALVTIVFLPLMTDDPETLSDRGSIWMLSRDNWLSGLGHFLSGNTLAFYGIDSEFARIHGSPVYHGHNEFVTVMTMTGIVSTLLLVAIFWAAFAQALSVNGRGRRPAALVLLALLYCSIAETPLRIDTVDSVGWISWLALFGLLFAASDSHEAESAPAREPVPPVPSR